LGYAIFFLPNNQDCACDVRQTEVFNSFQSAESVRPLRGGSLLKIKSKAWK
jgi:hypothetical protein